MSKTHGFCGLNSSIEKRRFYTTYTNILNRCNNISNRAYCNYGGRGIKCERGSFEEFKNDMWNSFLSASNKYGIKNISIDRIDNDGNYCKDNCRRATIDIQSFNKRNNIIFNIDGVERTGEKLAELLGCSIGRAFGRLHKYEQGKLSKDRVFSNGKLDKDIKCEINGEMRTTKRLVDEIGLTFKNAQLRLRKYLRGKISVNKLLYKGDLSKQPKGEIIIVDGIEYNSYSISEMCGISIGTARNRIVKYKRGLITKDELINVGRIRISNKISIGIDISGKHYSSDDIASICGITREGANYRIRKYKEGKISIDDLFYKGLNHRKIK